MPTPGNETHLSQSEAKNTGASGDTTKTNTVVVSRPFMEILIGGPYTKNRKDHTYGHAALRVFIAEGQEFVYDYGRYGKTWAGGSEGEGILRFWNSFSAYITGENALGRTTVGFVYYLEKQQAEAIVNYFGGVIAAGKQQGQPKKNEKDVVVVTTYRLANDYHAIQSNCVTISLDGTKASGINVYHNPEKYQELRGMSWTEKLAAKTQSYPKNAIFMPFDLQEMLEGAKTGGAKNSYNRRETYKK